jgi:hypothetical protein
MKTALPAAPVPRRANASVAMRSILCPGSACVISTIRLPEAPGWEQSYIDLGVQPYAPCIIGSSLLSPWLNWGQG